MGWRQIYLLPEQQSEYAGPRNQQSNEIKWLWLGLMPRQPLWVILCCLPEKGRKEIEEIAEDKKEGYVEKEKEKEYGETEEIRTPPPLPLPAARTAGLAQL